MHVGLMLGIGANIRFFLLLAVLMFKSAIISSNVVSI